MIIAGDIGGTKCNLCALEERGESLHPLFQKRFASRDFATLEKLLGAFLAELYPLCADPALRRISAAGFGVPGAMVGGHLQSINLPWPVDARSLAETLGLPAGNVLLLNDVAATACGLEKLSARDFLVLNEGKPQPGANRALLAAGTGLGEAILFWDGRRHVVSATEGGVADFAPRNDREIGLLQFLQRTMARVSCEELLSGRGFRRIHEFLDPACRHPAFDGAAADSAQAITENALARACPACIATLDLWADLLGAEAGNLALRSLARDGVYVAGGIALKILPKLRDGAFSRSFSRKEPLNDMLAAIPQLVVLSEDAPLWGAAHEALRLTRVHTRAGA